MGRSGAGSGGGRSGGGFSSGSRRSGSFGGGSRSGRSGGSGFSSGRGSGGHYSSGPSYRGPVFVSFPRFGGRTSYTGGTGAPQAGGCSSGFFKWVLIILALCIVIGAVGSCTAGESASEVPASTVQREALPAGSAVETEYFTDEPGWIGSSSKLVSGMKQFYKQTGVQPYLYIAEMVDGTRSPTSAVITAYAEQLYDKLFTDEAHFLLVYCDNGSGRYICGYTMGSLVKTIMDDEALDILSSYLDRYYTEDLNDEEYFSRSFSKTAERIMTVTKSPWPNVVLAVVICAAAVIIVALLFKWWRHRKQQKNLEAKQREAILNTPLEKFGDLEVEELEKKYQDSAGGSKTPPGRDTPGGLQ